MQIAAVSSRMLCLTCHCTTVPHLQREQSPALLPGALQQRQPHLPRIYEQLKVVDISQTDSSHFIRKMIITIKALKAILLWK